MTGTLGVGIIDALQDEARWLMTGTAGAARRTLLLDLSGVAKCRDGAGLYVLLGMSRILEGRGVLLMLTSASPAVEAQIRQARLQDHLRRGRDQESRDT
ncbi:STAS domain-containing protein [Streptomyces sp. CRN 30]|uniref:STAS domain-containing protein n=1 Tax=Streptomyces sp. CRN 30 TaxID=3075613 RepID=UPI002A83B438|nr:STAS domain-containing protein [Streptomyces sp. CRN 30]